MTLEAWLRSREPAPPAALTTRMLAALGSDAAREHDDVGAACFDAASRVLKPLLDDERTGRDSALDLLAADALVTYAFEAAAERFDTIDATTAAAMLRLAELAGDSETRPVA